MLQKRLPIILSATALTVAVLGSTSLGQAAKAPPKPAAVPFAVYASNAGLLGGHKASTNPKAGQIPVLGVPVGCS